jgi:hypothetical protein
VARRVVVGADGALDEERCDEQRPGDHTAGEERFRIHVSFLLREDGPLLDARPPTQLAQPIIQRLRPDAHAAQHPDGHPVRVTQDPQQYVLGA